MRENQGEECHGAHFLNSGLIIPLDPSPTLDPLSLCVRGKEPQMTVTHIFIQHVKPMMMYTDDARTVSSNIEHHHGLWVQEQLAGDGGGKLGMLIAFRHMSCQPIKQNLINRVKGTVGSM